MVTTAPSIAPATDGLRQVVLRRLPSHIGQRILASRRSSMKVAVEFWQEGQKLGSNELSRSEEYSRDVEVLGLLGGAPAKVRVRYDQYHMTEIHPDKPPRDESMLAHHAYEVDAAEGAVKVLGERGQAVTPEEAETLQKLHGDLGEDDPLVTALGTGPIVVGQPTHMREPLFRALVSTGTGDFKSGTMVLSSVREEGQRAVAVFDWSAEMKTEEDNGLEITWHLKGKAIVGVSPALTLHTSVDGLLDVGGHTKQNGARVDLAGDGAFKDEHTVSPSVSTAAPSASSP